MNLTLTFRNANKMYTFASIQRASKTMRRTPEQVLALITGEDVSTVWEYKPL